MDSFDLKIVELDLLVFRNAMLKGRILWFRNQFCSVSTFVHCFIVLGIPDQDWTSAPEDDNVAKK